MICSDPVIKAVLAPLAIHYDPPEVIEVRMSRSRTLTIEVRGQGKVEITDTALGIGYLEHLCKTLANYSGLAFDPDRAPTLSCILPGGHRFECAVGSSVQSGLSLAIRVKHPFQARPRDFGLDAAMTDLLLASVANGQHLVISGGTNTGKTTFLNMLLQSLPEETRIVCAEDAPEIDIGKFTDSVGLIAARSGHVPGMLEWPQLNDHINRITPDRVIFGEISVRNAMSALSALNSGISGFMCTIHAASPEMAINRKFDQNLDMAGHQMKQLGEFLTDLVDLVIQIERLDGTRKVSAVYAPKADAYLLGT